MARSPESGVAQNLQHVTLAYLLGNICDSGRMVKSRALRATATNRRIHEYQSRHDHRRRAVAPVQESAARNAVLSVLGAVSFSHFLNDLIQSLLPSIYPMLKSSYALDFGQIGLLTFTYQITASLLQPLVGAYTDRRPLPYSLPVGMGFTLCGLLLLSQAGTFSLLLVAAALVGTGSSVFHPESSRIARLASGGRHGFAQSFFQVGGNTGSALGPLLAAFVILPHGQGSLAWFGLLALLGIVLLSRVGALVLASGAEAKSDHERRRIRADIATASDRVRDRRAARADLLQVFLSDQPVELLHVLSDREIRG